MLENYDTRKQIEDLAAWFEREHAARPFNDEYAAGARRAYAAFIEPDGPEENTRGFLEALFEIIDEVGLDNARFLLSVERKSA